ncbi:methyltransferase domain-containing protein [Blastococcus sp. SYSU D00695]
MLSPSGPPSNRPELLADRAGLTLWPGHRARLPDVVDVLLEGQRTVSLRTGAAEPLPDGGVRLAWPVALAARLAGTVAVTVRDPVSKDVLAAGEVVLDGSAGRLDLRDDRGRWLSINKWGRLAPSFDGLEAAAREALQDRLLDGLRVVQEELEAFGLRPFVCYGTLLGGVRDGDLIPHDDDADLAYLSEHRHPADVVRENLELARALRRRGFAVTRHSGGHLQLTFDTAEGPDHYIDVFTAFVVEDRTYLCFQVGSDDLDLSALGEVVIRGRTYPAPADAERLLAATYGPGWRTPDPSFTFTTPHAVRSRLRTWIGEFNMQRDYWQDFYSSQEVTRVPAAESDFARWVADRLPEDVGVLDVGTGTARDARFFARSGRRVLAVDYSAAAVERGRAKAQEEGWVADFRVVNLADLHQVGGVAADLDHGLAWHLYARFLVHAIDDETRANLWTLAAAVARRGGECWLEFRTAEDAKAQHVFGEHFRRYLELPSVVAELEERGLRVLESTEGRGMAVYKDEDPWVARLRLGAA